MRRRDFLGTFGAASAWPLVTRAQLGAGQLRRIGVLQAAASNPDQQARFAAFRQALQQLGWVEGSNLLIYHRWGSGDAESIHKYATELVALAPDVIVATGGAVDRLLQATRSVPIVFVIVADPVGSGLVDSLSHPGGNATGFMQFEYNLCAKWPELLKQAAPGIKRVAVLRDPTITAGIGQFAVIQSVAPALGVEVSPINLRNAGEIERAIGAFAVSPNGGFILSSSPVGAAHRDLIIMLAARHRLPAIYPNPSYGPIGGLISYGPDLLDQFRSAASYVDRILKGERPADLPVQAPSKYPLVLRQPSIIG